MAVRTFYIGLTPGKNLGTKEDPFAGVQFDAAIEMIKRTLGTSPRTPTQINIAPGQYITRGFAPFENWDIRLAQGTTLKLADVGNGGFRHPTNCVIATAQHGSADGPDWLESFSIKGGKLDCNWLEQSARLNPGAKFAGLYILSPKTKIQNVEVVNFGSNGKTVPGSQPFMFSECFPIMAETYADEATTILIERCHVHQQQREGGGYATAIMVRTTQDTPTADRGDRLKWATPRKSLCATVRMNVCDDIYGNAVGCGFSERVLFQENVGRNCKTFCNVDSGRNRAIKFLRNKALGCNQGIHIGNFYDGEFSGFTIQDNIFHLTEPWVNLFLTPPVTEYSFGVRLTKLPTGARIIGNTFTAWPTQSKNLGRVGICTGDGVEKPIMENNTFCGFPDEFAENLPFHLQT